MAPAGLKEFKELMDQGKSKLESSGLPLMVAKLLQ